MSPALLTGVRFAVRQLVMPRDALAGPTSDTIRVDQANNARETRIIIGESLIELTNRELLHMGTSFYAHSVTGLARAVTG